MKLILIVCLMMIAAISKAQPNMLGKTANYIKEQNALPSGIGYFTQDGVQNDSTTFVQFVAKNDSRASFRYYINKNGICDYLIIMQPVSDMVGTIQALNENYLKIGDSAWINKSNDLDITLTYQKGSDIFTTGFSKIE